MYLRYHKSTFAICAFLFWIIDGHNVKVIRQDIAEETQHAICNISTKDVQTSANASVTRQLKGVCTSKQLGLYFKKLELKISHEFQSIKKMLIRTYGEKIVEADDDTDISKSPLKYSPLKAPPQEFMEEYGDIEESLPIFSSYKTLRTTNDNDDDEEPIFHSVQQKTENLDELLPSVQRKMDNESVTIVDMKQIKNLNDTIQKRLKKNIYYYFWAVENFNNLMKKTDMYVTSPSFMVLGHDLVIQVFPNQPQKNYLTIKLRTTNSFVKKHKFSILTRTTTGNNINSLVLGTDPKGGEKFSVPLRSIKNFECIKEDNIIIELNIFL
ncbi:uncharacterized protein LOC123319462 [Coccinella septempunctata]|uniref:uncharacterized protein LOC123319462 n=1 Tax=Coccinella septempunctata TaxID=41139 RepID=UPI001D06681B|nr:uncharacterized protein LOC123319462 [Coccinella septempunctata]XP_044762387.1 uncharacterized protein LOC123319462 [Coccinella septempunctata]XP_044762388.1 uncharacterized protein LOC123319462 [Coccinella septempunctata]XP_044762389.1 uncharacterized protein LOC123319462 [Coccinella septempunctata]